jgi:DNA-binding CsgD family transcriptional regulator
MNIGTRPPAHGAPSELDAPPASGESAVEARFELAGCACRIVRVDDVVPNHCPGPEYRRTRLTYIEDEVAHFEFAGHHYALVLEPVRSTSELKGDASHAAARALLTNRELQIVQLICMGLLTKQVADRLHISEFTVRSYLKTIYCKLGVRSRGAMVFRYAQTFKADGFAAVVGVGAPKAMG